MIKRKSSLHFTNHCCFLPFLPCMGNILFGELLIIHVEFVLSLHSTLVLSFSSPCCNICHFTFQPAAFMWQVNIPVYPFRLFLTVNPAGISTSVRTSTGAYLCVCIVVHKPAVIFWYIANVWIFWVHPIKRHSNWSVTNKLNALNSAFFSHVFDLNSLNPLATCTEHAGDQGTVMWLDRKWHFQTGRRKLIFIFNLFWSYVCN